jgi:hypothetical protein
VLAPPEDNATRRRGAATRYRNQCFKTIEDALGQPLGVVLNPVGTQRVHTAGNVLFLPSATQARAKLPRPLVSALAISPDGDVSVSVQADHVSAAMPADSLLILKRR